MPPHCLKKKETSRRKSGNTGGDFRLYLHYYSLYNGSGVAENNSG